MYPVQRCLKTIRFDFPESVPVVPLTISHAAQLARVPFWSYNRDPILDYMTRTGADLLEWDHFNDFAEARRRAGGTTCLEGNVDPTRVLFQGTPELIRQKSIELIRAAGEDGGLIPTSGREVPRNIPPTDIFGMVGAAREFGGGERRLYGIISTWRA